MRPPVQSEIPLTTREPLLGLVARPEATRLTTPSARSLRAPEIPSRKIRLICSATVTESKSTLGLYHV